MKNMPAQVLMRPYLVFEDGHTDPNLWGARVADRPPTSSPPLRTLTGGATMRIYNNGSAIPVRISPGFSGSYGVLRSG